MTEKRQSLRSGGRNLRLHGHARLTWKFFDMDRSGVPSRCMWRAPGCFARPSAAAAPIAARLVEARAGFGPLRRPESTRPLSAETATWLPPA